MKRALIALTLWLLGSTSAFAQSTASQLTVATPASNTSLAADKLNEPSANGTPHIERVAREPRRIAWPVLGRSTTGSANTPVRAVTATPTAGATTPTMTPLSFGWCSICACPTNTDTVYWSTSSTVSTSTGEALLPGQCRTGLPAIDYTCGGFYLVSATSSQCWTINQEN